MTRNLARGALLAALAVALCGCPRGLTVCRPPPPHWGHGTHPVGAVPEPATWSLVICGSALLGAALRTRRRVPS